MGRPEMLNQGVAGFMLQLLKAGRLNRDRQRSGSGAEMIRRTRRADGLQSEHDLTHGVWRMAYGLSRRAILCAIAVDAACLRIRLPAPAGTQAPGRRGTAMRLPLAMLVTTAFP
jgi:hypothetical protein